MHLFRSLFFRSLLLLVSLLSGWPVATAAVTLLDAPRVEMAGSLALRIDPGKRLTVDEVADPRAAAGFMPLPDQVGLGLVEGAVWLRFTVENILPSAAEWWLEVQPPYNNHIDLYIPQAGGGYAVRRAGASLPFSAREIAYRNPVFKLTLPGGTPQTYYLRIDAGKRVKARLTFWQPAAFIEAAGREQIAFGLYLGVYLLLVLASLWFEAAVRDRVYLYFGLFVFSVILTTLTTTGLWQQYVLPDQPQLLDVALGFSVPLLIGMCVQFLFRFIGMGSRQPRLTRVYLASVWGLCALTFLASAAGHYAVAMHWFYRYVFFFIVPSLCLVLLRPALHSADEIRHAFVGGALFLLFSFMFHALAAFRVIRPNVFADNAMYVGSMVFFLIVYYAVSRRYKAMRMAKEAAQKEALRVSRRSEQELERQVAARTDQLTRAVQTAEAALAQARAVQQEQRQFIVTVSHELRTPLAVIDATAQNLEREGAQASPKGQTRLRKIRQATGRLSMLFDDYLNEERLDAFTQGIDPRRVAVLPLLQDAVEAAQALADGHVLSIDEADFPLTIWADPRLLRLVLRTLVDNAVKYTPPGTRVTLKAAQTDAGWRIDVADDGPGIPAEEQCQIFERYYRGRASACRVGTGLGLPLGRKLVGMHGGTLRLVSPPEGGCCFRIWLPRPSLQQWPSIIALEGSTSRGTGRPR